MIEMCVLVVDSSFEQHLVRLLLSARFITKMKELSNTSGFLNRRCIQLICQVGKTHVLIYSFPYVIARSVKENSSLSDSFSPTPEGKCRRVSTVLYKYNQRILLCIYHLEYSLVVYQDGHIDGLFEIGRAHV